METKPGEKGYRINEIKIEEMLPKVFVGEHLPASEVWNTSLTLNRGGRYLIEAASGAGKSSLCAFIYGARRDYIGNLSFNGVSADTISISQWQSIRRENIAYLPQELMLFPELSAIDNIMLKDNINSFIDMKEVEEWLDLLGISSRRDFPVGRMSVGQQQRVAIIRSICQPFDFILLDEPVSHLDEVNNRIAAELVEKQASRLGAAIVSTSVGNPLLLDNAVTIKL